MKATIDFAKLDLTDITTIELNNDEDTCTVVLEPVVGPGGERASYEETISFSKDQPSARMKAAAREFALATLEYVRERGTQQQRMPCLTCVGACCTNKEGVVRVTDEDIGRLSVAFDGLKWLKEYVTLYEEKSWTGYVGQLNRGPIKPHNFGGETEGCVFLTERGCSVYKYRPQICRDYSPWNCGDTYTEDSRKVAALKDGKYTLLVVP